MPLHRQRQHPEQHALKRDDANAAIETARAEQEQVAQHQKDQRRVDRGQHRITSTSERGRETTGSWRRPGAAERASRRQRAVNDSTIPVRTATPTMPAMAAPQSSHSPPPRTGTASPTMSAASSHSFRDRGVEDERQVRTAVVEHHDLVNHRQLEMRGRVVDRNARVLGQEDDAERGHQQGEHRARPASSLRRRRRRTFRRARGCPSVAPERRAPAAAPAPPAPRTSPRGSRPCPRSSSRCRAPPATVKKRARPSR